MKEWNNLTDDERKEARGGLSRYERCRIMDECHRSVLDILRGHNDAVNKAWKMAWGNFLINTPEEIAAHCLGEANI